MKPALPIAGWLVALLSLWGCRPSTPPPWVLIELGSGSVAEAMIDGWIAAEVDHRTHWLQPDADNSLATLARDLHSLPEIACGDLMRLAPGDLPLSVRDAFGWRERVDSMTVRWHRWPNSRAVNCPAGRGNLAGMPTRLLSTRTHTATETIVTAR